MHDAVKQAVSGFLIKVVAPCEGTGYEIGSMSIIDGARNSESAKKFYDWALSAVRNRWRFRSRSIRFRPTRETSSAALDLSSIKR